MSVSTTMEPISIRFVPTGYRRYPCFFCGGESWRESVQPMVYSGKDQNGVICRHCLAATPAEFTTCLRERAKDLTQLAMTLSELADDVPPRPTLEAFEAEVKAQEKAIAEDRLGDEEPF